MKSVKNFQNRINTVQLTINYNKNLNDIISRLETA